jgi:hypothetical protein
MKYLLLILMTTAIGWGEQPALKEQALPAIKATMLVPEGWHIKEQSEDGVTVYQITREKAEAEGDIFSAGLILSVTTKVPDRASMKPSEYANDLLTSEHEEGDGAKLVKTEEGPLRCLRLDYTIESDQGNIKVVNLAKANDNTGTLYFATWQSPETEEPKLKELRESVLSSIKLDPSF